MDSLCYLGQLKADGVDNAIYKLHSSPPFIDKENTVNYSRIIVQNILEIYHYPETAPGFLFFFEILLPAGRFVAILVFLLSGCCHIFNIKSYHVVVLTWPCTHLLLILLCLSLSTTSSSAAPSLWPPCPSSASSSWQSLQGAAWSGCLCPPPRWKGGRHWCRASSSLPRPFRSRRRIYNSL